MCRTASARRSRRTVWRSICAGPAAPIDAAHIFVIARARLEEALAQLLPLLAPSGFIWVSWPKKASKVPTDISEGTIREVALPLGLVDVKVCAIDATWSGLKLMKRRKAIATHSH